MASYPAIRTPDRCPTHPGELLREEVLPTGMPKAQIARLLGISRQQKALRQRADVWACMQAAWDIWQAEQTVDVSTIPTLAA